MKEEEEDPIDESSEKQKYINENIKDSELHIINGAGHFPFVDSPFEYEEIILNYFNL